MFSTRFYAAAKEFATFESPVPAPYLRRAVHIPKPLQKAVLCVCGLGFYRLFINGADCTDGLLAPYISNPDHILYYNEYDLTSRLTQGENALGFLLGNGMLNCPGGAIWSFDQVPWRSAPKVAFAFELTYEDGTSEIIEADETLRCHPSPIWFDDLRAGERYDATREIPGWCQPGFDDSGWSPALSAETPRGECRIRACEPIVITRSVAPVRFYRGKIAHQTVPRADLPVYQMTGVEAETEGWIYDFGVNAAGLCRLHVQGRPGQKLVLYFCEEVSEDGSGNLDLRGMTFLPIAFNHRDIYICRGGDEEYLPSFTYHGFRYCLVLGLDDAQATEGLLTYEVMNSALESIGSFSCSDDTVNKLEQATLVSDLANFYYFPTDCPHREKNGWTADAALSAEHILTNFRADESYREWLRNIVRAQKQNGVLPGIIPTGEWGYMGGNGPAWDSVLFYLPYYLYQYRGDTDTLRKTAAGMMLYLHYLTTRRNADGLLAIGLGDWCPSGRVNIPKSPQVFTDSVISMDICAKAEKMFRAIGMTVQAEFAASLRASLRAAVRTHLIDPYTLAACGNCQTSQAMAIYYGVYEPGEQAQAFRLLVDIIGQNGNRMDVGVLGARVLFHVLSSFGRTDLAYEMITTPEFPSYAYWIKTLGATSLFEDFVPLGQGIASHNHHFWGDIASWFARELAGLKINPYLRNCNEVELSPRFIDALEHAEARHILPCGEVSVRWNRTEDGKIALHAELPSGAHGRIRLECGWKFDTGESERPAVTGDCLLIRADALDSRTLVP